MKQNHIFLRFYWELVSLLSELIKFRRRLNNYFFHCIAGHLVTPGYYWVRLFFLQNCRNSLGMVLIRYWKTFLRDLDQYWPATVAVHLLAAHSWCESPVPKVLCWTKMWWLGTVNSMSCPRNQFWMVWALSHGALSCCKQPSEVGYTVVKKGWA